VRVRVTQSEIETDKGIESVGVIETESVRERV
jgi:hypothetical protein